ncbi:Tex family protein [Methanothrix sp.]|uniref:Tex family protein n=1 Tax=Methanothrix sp. TaxID=90426 RepID=UPI003BB72ADA
MLDRHIESIASELSLDRRAVRAVSELIDSGATLPFIARYRKEATGDLDEVAIGKIRDSLNRTRLMDERRMAIIRSLARQGQLSAEIEERLSKAASLAELEDIYLPFRPKRRTRAMVAKERGLEPLARIIFAQDERERDPEEEAAPYIDPEKGVSSVHEALQGAMDIIAEWISEDTQSRSEMRFLFWSDGVLQTRAKAGTAHPEEGKFRDYLELSEPIARMSSHRLLAALRGAKRGVFSLHLVVNEEEALSVLEEIFIKGDGPASGLVMAAARDSFRRLLAPSLETETISIARQRAEEKAIEIFADNLRQLLLEPPLGRRCVLAVDPGFRTGCKLVVLDPLGRLIKSDVIYPHEPHNKTREAGAKVARICQEYDVEVIAVGNGTAGRETESFLRRLNLPRSISIVPVNESGASVYSTSARARSEFPDQDATVRGAVSIGRRLQDPLAELVKIEPQAIGVGQYQHDVDPSSLGRSLDDVVEACVNLVGVDVNAASIELLARVSGLGLKLAEAVVRYRNEHGPFRSRRDLLAVPRLGPKAFEQAAGFLRIHDGDNPLDRTAVHPERYPIVERMAKDLGVSVSELVENEELLSGLNLEDYMNQEEGVGASTLQDIINELFRPGRDPRREYEAFSFAPGIKEIGDLQVGMSLPGIVTNVTSFGAFVDVGVHQDGLVHKSELASGFVPVPGDVVRVRQKVMVKVLDVDLERKRIALSIKR